MPSLARAYRHSLAAFKRIGTGQLAAQLVTGILLATAIFALAGPLVYLFLSTLHKLLYRWPLYLRFYEAVLASLAIGAAVRIRAPAGEVKLPFSRVTGKRTETMAASARLMAPTHCKRTCPWRSITKEEGRFIVLKARSER